MWGLSKTLVGKKKRKFKYLILARNWNFKKYLIKEETFLVHFMYFFSPWFESDSC